MTIPFDIALDVLRVIQRHTREHPVSGEAVSELCSVPTRTVAEIVSVAVSKGVPVGSCSLGYFQWRSREEREEYFAREKARLQSLGRKLSQAKKHSANPLTLFEQDAA